MTAAVLGLLGVGGYFAWKHFGNAPMGGGGGGANAPMAGVRNAPMAGGGDGTMNGLGPGAEKVMAHTRMSIPMRMRRRTVSARAARAGAIELHAARARAPL